MLHVERYDPKIHGQTSWRGRPPRDWEQVFSLAREYPVVVRGVSRNAIYQHAARRGLSVRCEALADGDGYVVSVRRSAN